MNRILGQARAVEALASAYRSGRFHHAWIFAGPMGVGKLTAAVEFAKILLDPGAPLDPREYEPGETARLIEAGTHPDLHVIRKELSAYSDNSRLRDRLLSNIPLDLLRERVIGGRTGDGRFHEGPAYKTPVLGHAKVFIIDEAELLEPEGQNTLLKTLEEPPPKTYIFLVTSQPQRLLPTIHSRCQLVRFTPLDDDAMAAWFEQAALDVDDEQRSWIERYSEGSPGRAELAVRYGFHRWRTALAPLLRELENDRFPLEMGQTMAGLVEEFAVAWVKEHDNASKDAANKDGARHLLSMLAAYARRRLAETAGGDDPQPWLRTIDLLRAAERQLNTNVNLKLLLENLVVQWVKEPSAISHQPSA